MSNFSYITKDTLILSEIIDRLLLKLDTYSDSFVEDLYFNSVFVNGNFVRIREENSKFRGIYLGSLYSNILSVKSMNESEKEVVKKFFDLYLLDSEYNLDLILVDSSVKNSSSWGEEQEEKGRFLWSFRNNPICFILSLGSFIFNFVAALENFMREHLYNIDFTSDIEFLKSMINKISPNILRYSELDSLQNKLIYGKYSYLLSKLYKLGKLGKSFLYEESYKGDKESIKFYIESDSTYNISLFIRNDFKGKVREEVVLLDDDIKYFVQKVDIIKLGGLV